MEEKIDDNIKSEKNSIIIEVKNWIVSFLICLGIAWFLTNFILINGFVPSSSMENTVMTKDRFFGNRFAYVFDEPERFDVIVFPAPDEPEKILIKRIIGLPGDTIEFVEGQLYINGELEVEPYLKEEMVGSFGPYNVPEGSCLTLGDNRNYSVDSRKWVNTYVDINTIKGEAVFTYFPKIHLIK